MALITSKALKKRHTRQGIMAINLSGAAERLSPSDSADTPLVQEGIQVIYVYVLGLTLRMAEKVDHSTLAASVLMAPSSAKISSWGRKNGPRRRRAR